VAGGAGRKELTDLGDPVMCNEPFARYAYLRRSCPVSRVKAPLLLRGTGYMVTRYDDVMAFYTDPRFSSDFARYGVGSRFLPLAPPSIRVLVDSMVMKDDPEHHRLRSLVRQAFNARRVAALTGDIARIARSLTDRLAAVGEIDLVADYAVQLPLALIAIMLGVDDDDRDKFHELCCQLTQSIAAGPRQLFRTVCAAHQLSKLFEHLVRQRRREPDDGLISGLVRANHDCSSLSDREGVAMIFLLLLAGHDTTTNLIGSSVLALLDDSEQLARLRAEPALMDTGIDELLRFTSPVPCGAPRTALEDVEIAGTRIPKGSQVLGMLISANRDESVFTDPYMLDLSRKPNKHIAFAAGPHHCLGHQLARLEGRIALTELLGRFADLEIAVPRSQLQFKRLVALRGLTSLPMRVR
jgi:cytochrome P450